MFKQGIEYQVRIPIDKTFIQGILEIPKASRKIVIFAHGSRSSRLSPRNGLVAKYLRTHGIGTLLIDLLTVSEDELYSMRFDIQLLAQRVRYVTEWLFAELADKRYTCGYFGASTGSAAALIASIQTSVPIKAIVSRGGRPDLAKDILPAIFCPTLFIVGKNDDEVVELNRNAFNQLTCKKSLEIIPNATHLFEEKGALEKVAEVAMKWFKMYL